MISALARFLNKHLLSRFNARVMRHSTLEKLTEEKYRLQESQKAIAQRLAKFEAQNAQRLEALALRMVDMENSFAARITEIESRLHERLDRQEKLLVQAKPFASAGTQSQFLMLARHFSPRSAVGYRKIRVGRAHDGGYIMLDDFEDIDAAFSFGVGDDASWDLQVASRGIPTYQFDGSIDASPVLHPNLHFLARNIVPQPNRDGETIGGLLERFGTKSDHACILKLDVEHDEWDILHHAEFDALRHFAQIICEFHFFSRATDPAWYTRALAVMKKLSDAFQVIHVHGNNYRPLVSIGNVPFPELLEVSFANRERYQFRDSEEVFPTPIDQPNWAAEPDLFLGRFQF
jgi:hypothetical protein